MRPKALSPGVDKEELLDEMAESCSEAGSVVFP